MPAVLDILRDSNLTGMEQFIESGQFYWKKEFPACDNGKKDYIIAVHHHVLTFFDTKKSQESRKVYESICGLIEKNRDFTYHSQKQPYDIPLGWEDDKLPYPDSVRFLFLVGCYGDKCVKSQAEYLFSLGYLEIFQVAKLIRGPLQLKDKTVHLY